MVTVYTIASAPEYWGPECRPEWGEELAEALAEALRQYAKAQGLDAEVRVVHETFSIPNRPSGDETIIAALEAEQERLLNHSTWEWARGTRAWEEWH